MAAILKSSSFVGWLFLWEKVLEGPGSKVQGQQSRADFIPFSFLNSEPCEQGPRQCRKEEGDEREFREPIEHGCEPLFC